MLPCRYFAGMVVHARIHLPPTNAFAQLVSLVAIARQISMSVSPTLAEMAPHVTILSTGELLPLG